MKITSKTRGNTRPKMSRCKKPLSFNNHTVSLLHLSLVLLHLTLVPCHAVVLRLPLKQAVGVVTIADEDTQDRSRRTIDPVTQGIQGISGEGYYLDVNIGTPPQQMQVLVDTGSSNFAVAAGPDPHISHYFNISGSSTYYQDGEKIYVPYTQGEWDGVLGMDVVSLDSLPNVSITANIAFIVKSTGFFIPEANWQGIVGFAYQSIARPDTLEPFWDNLRRTADIDDIFSMQLCGSALSHNSSASPANLGELVLGGVSDDLYKGEIFYTPIVKEMYYEVVISDMAVGGVSLALDCKEYNFDKTIVDSGTTHLRLPTRVFQAVVSAIKLSLQASDVPHITPPPSFWIGDDLLCWLNLSTAFDVFPDVSVSLVSSTAHNKYFTLHLSAQHYLRNVANIHLFGVQKCLKFGISPSDSGAVLGALLMESFFVVFDRQSKSVGFAATTCSPPYSNSRSPVKVIEGLQTSTANLTSCQYLRAVSDESTMLIVTYVMAAVCVVCALPLLILLVQWQVRKCVNKRKSRHDAEAETVLTDGSR